MKQVCDDSMVFTTEVKLATKAVTEDSEKICTLDDFLQMSATADEFYLHMEYFPSRVKDIEIKTRGQSNNPLWMAVRKHMISASKAHAVKTRMASIEKAKIENKVLDLTAIFKKISGEGPLLDLPSLRYGQAMESEAIAAFLKHLKTNTRRHHLHNVGFLSAKTGRSLGAAQTKFLNVNAVVNFALKLNALIPSETSLQMMQRVS